MAEAKSNARIPEETWRELLTPEALAEYGALDVAYPGDHFDPKGAWTQSWQIYVLRKIQGRSKHGGHIEIARQPAEGLVRLSIRQANIQATHLARRYMANHPCMNGGVFIKPVCDTRVDDIICHNDQLLTPQSWTIWSEMRCPEGKLFEGTHFEKEMRIKDGRMETQAYGKTSLRPLPSGNITSNWGLLNTLSMVEGEEPLAFTMLDELDKIKTGHKLYRAADRTIDFGGNQVKVYCYQQIGNGCLPWEYYVDASTRRVLLAISGLRAYILDNHAAENTAKLYAGYDRKERIVK